MRIAVIGATGNVGTAVLRRLAALPEVDAIVGVARRSPVARIGQYRDVAWHEIDVGDEDARGRLRRALAGSDAVIHLAWALQPSRDEPSMWRTNVRGTANVLAAAAEAGVKQIVVASSVGAYSVGPKRRRVPESWPTGGVPTSPYSRHKAINERAMDVFELDHPDIRLARIRPGLVFQRDAGSEIARLFLGPLVPAGVLRRVRPRVLPLPTGFIVQAVHADDLADAYWRAVDHQASGAFNIAAEPVLTPPLIAAAFGAERTRPFRAHVLRIIMELTWRAGLQPTDPGWLDIATAVPVMSTERARRELGWSPAITATAAFAEVVDGMAAGDGAAGSAPLAGRHGNADGVAPTGF
ncbi:MAG TPA: NAD-dependent epimerase/dehydratase family protein [Galbitalea sp.]|jgi:nucleoside-diphosphate-sugar epimerase